jgi:hypothetical protein
MGEIGGYLLWAAVELAKALAWPITIYVVAKILVPLLPRIVQNRKVELEWLGAKATIGAAEQQNVGPDNPNEAGLAIAAAANGIEVPSATPASAELEQRIRQDLERFPPEQRVNVLLRHLSMTRLMASHEWVYNRILGSQIAGLRAVNERGKVPLQEARDYFATVVERYPDAYENYKSKAGCTSWRAAA